jgi:hypothetical protein
VIGRVDRATGSGNRGEYENGARGLRSSVCLELCLVIHSQSTNLVNDSKNDQAWGLLWGIVVAASRLDG